MIYNILKTGKKISFVALQPGLSGLGTNVSTAGKMVTVGNQWVEAFVLGGPVEYGKGTTAKEVLKETVSVYVFLP